jgi:TPR repeat protein
MIKVTEKLKEIIDKSNLISEIIEFIFKITNLGKGKILGMYVSDYFNDINVNPQVLYNWLLNNQPNSDSIFLLGYLSYYGIGTELSYEKAFNLFSDACNASEQNHILALYHVGLCYQKGRGTEQSEDLAFGYFKILAERKYAMGQFKLGFLFSRLKQHQKAAKWYKIAAENGNIMAMYNLAKDLLEYKDYVNSIELLQKSANEGYSEAINTLGYCHENGLGTRPDRTKAAELYIKAARLGCLKSYCNLADMLKKDSDENKESLIDAVLLYKKAADQGDEYAYKELKTLSQKPNVHNDLKNLGEQGQSALMILKEIN